MGLATQLDLIELHKLVKAQQEQQSAVFNIIWCYIFSVFYC